MGKVLARWYFPLSYAINGGGGGGGGGGSFVWFHFVGDFVSYCFPFCYVVY